jgi:hypothetical protein
METPCGMEVGNGKFFVLKKTIYRFVKSSRKFYVKLVKALKSYQFTGSLVDPCLWVKQSNKGIVIIEIYLEDCLSIESDEDIKKFIEYLKNHDLDLN